MPKRRPLDARAAALRFLIRPDHERIHEARRQASAQLPQAQRSLFVELVAGVTRGRVLYDRIIAAYAQARQDRIEDRVLQVLRLALHQLLFLDRIPTHAAVDSSLDLLPSKRARGFVNAILRTLLREGRFLTLEEAESVSPRRWLTTGEDRAFEFGRDVFPDPIADPRGHLAAKQSFLPACCEVLVQELGLESATVLMESSNCRPHLNLRRDPQRSADVASFLERLAAEGLVVEEEPQSGGSSFRLRAGDPASTKAFAAGLFRVQGSFAASVAGLLAPKAGEKILDYCAPPGGKLLHLAELAPEAELFAFAHDARGESRLKTALDRKGLASVRVLTSGDPFTQGPFDAILLDLPCSNTGVLNRRPEARDRLTSKDLSSLSSLQRELLERGLSELKNRGQRLVYSTCSVLPSENEGLVRTLLEDRPELHLTEEISAFPDREGRDGGYAALIVRT